LKPDSQTSAPNYIYTPNNYKLNGYGKSATGHIKEPVPTVGGKNLKKRRFRATANERILIHLLDYIREREEVEYPREITQAGIAEILDTVRSHVSLALSALKDKGYVIDRLGRVENEIRRRKVYFLSPKGYSHANGLKQGFLRTRITVPIDGQTEEVRIEDLDDFLDEDYFLVDVLSCINSQGVLNLFSLTGESGETPDPDQPTQVEPQPDPEPPQDEEDGIIEPKDSFEMAVPQFQARCPNCASYFFIQTLTPLSEVQTRCPNCLHVFMPLYHQAPRPAQQKERKFNAGSFTGGVGLVSTMILAPLLIFPYFLCTFYILGIPLSIALFLHAFAQVKKLTEIQQKYVIIGLSFIAFCAMLLIHAVLTRTHPFEFFYDILIITVPFFVLLLLSFRIRLELAREILVILGIAYLILGFLGASMPEGLAWAKYLYPFFIIIGAAALLLAHTAAGYKHFTPEGICTGVGIPISISAISWIIHYSTPLYIEGAIPAAMWLFLGLFLVGTRFSPANVSKRITEGLKATAPYALGAFFIALGVLLLIGLRFTESVIPLVVGIPIAYLGVESPVKAPRKDRVILLTFSTILLLATLYPIFLL
jgi:predicted Zn finger-like uncharacterized protein